MSDFTWPLHDEGYQLCGYSARASEKKVRSGSTSKYNTERRVPEGEVPETEHSGPSDKLWVQPVASATRSETRRRQYAPMRNPVLFRTFADVRCDPDAIVDFANRFGLLTDAEEGESIGTWKAEITDMRAAVACWEEALHVPRSVEARTGYFSEYFTKTVPVSRVPDWDMVLATTLSQHTSNVRPVFIQCKDEGPLAG